MAIHPLQSSGQISTDDIMAELGITAHIHVDLMNLASGVPVPLNSWNDLTNIQAIPYGMSDWYGYNHLAGAELLITYGSTASFPATTLAKWNSLFKLGPTGGGTYGNPFTGIGFSGNTINLRGGSNIIYNGGANTTSLISFIDTAGCIINCEQWSTFAGATALTTVSLPACTITGHSMFQSVPNLSSLNLPVCTTFSHWTCMYCYALTNLNIPSVTFMDYQSLVDCTGLTSLYIPACTNFGGSSLNDNVLFYLNPPYWSVQHITVPSYLQTNNSGNPDGDLQLMLANNPSLVITYV